MADARASKGVNCRLQTKVSRHTKSIRSLAFIFMNTDVLMIKFRTLLE